MLIQLRAALETEASGTYNIVGQGVLPLSTIVKLAGRNAMPVPGPLLRVATSAMFAAGLGEADGRVAGALHLDRQFAQAALQQRPPDQHAPRPGCHADAG